MRRANIIEEKLKDLTTQLYRVAQQIQNLTEELNEIRLGENETEIPDENITVLDTVKILNPPYITGIVKKTTRCYVWVKEAQQGNTLKRARKNVERITVTSQRQIH